MPPPERALTSSVPLSWAGSNGFISATSRPGSVNANGTPRGEPQLVPTSGTVSPTWRVTYLRVIRATSRPSGSEDCQSSSWRSWPAFTRASEAAMISRLACSTASASCTAIRVGAALADRLVDRNLKRRRALVPGELAEQLTKLLLLGEHLVIRAAAAQLGAAVDAEQPPVPRPKARALAQAVERMHVDRERERPLDLHRVQQPAELGRVRQRRHVQRLLEVAVDAQVALVGAVDRRVRDELAQRVRGARRLAGIGHGVELADELEPLLACSRPALRCAIGSRRVEAPPQQIEHLRSRQHVRAEIERLKVTTDRVRHMQRLARHPPMRLERPLQRRRGQRSAADRKQIAPADPHPLVGDVRDDHVVGDVDGGLGLGVSLQRLAQRGVKPRERRSPPAGVAAKRPPRPLCLRLAVLHAPPCSRTGVAST